MNSKELFLNIYQVKSDPSLNFSFPLHGINHYDRAVDVHVARNSGRNISHISLEFSGVKASFLCLLMFESPNDNGVGLYGFAMMRVKLTLPQKALILLSCLNFLIDNNFLDVNFDYFREKIAMDLNDSDQYILQQYDKLLSSSKGYIKKTEKPSLESIPD